MEKPSYFDSKEQFGKNGSEGQYIEQGKDSEVVAFPSFFAARNLYRLVDFEGIINLFF